VQTGTLITICECHFGTTPIQYLTELEIDLKSGRLESAATEAFLKVRSDHECFGCGDRNPIGLHLHFASDEDGVKATFVPAPEHQGFQGVIHGGIIAAVLDEAIAWATAHAGFWAVTGEMRIRFRLPLSVGEPATVLARVSDVRNRVVNTTAELTRDRDRIPIATASATFMRVSAAVEAEWRARYLQDAEVTG
jgi:acyl-coenzyme A thioesterase PaaI-like protein